MKIVFPLLLILVIGVFFRFIHLDWGSPYYFHPDERNIASSVSQIHFPHQLNPHFFAYGSFPIYLIYATSVFVNVINSLFKPISDIFLIDFELAIIVSRFFSAILSCLMIVLSYRIGHTLRSNNLGILVAFLFATSVCFIQYAHFGTFELWISFGALLLFYIHITNKNRSVLHFVISGIVVGLLGATKVSALVFFCIPLLFIVLTNLSWKKKIISLLKRSTIITCISIITYLLVSPYTILDNNSFLASMQYESSVALGTLPVFYTQAFTQTMPVIYQVKNIFPFLLNPILFITFLVLLPLSMYNTIIKKDFIKGLLLCILLFFLCSQIFLYVKWTRYMVPAIPFILLIIGLELSDIFNLFQKRFKKSLIGITIFILSYSLFHASAFVYTVYLQKETPIQALEFAQKNIPSNSNILSETYDLGIVPFNSSYPKIVLFNFYEIDNDQFLYEELRPLLTTTDYIILPSERIISTRMKKLPTFEKGTIFYEELLNQKLGFTKIYETPCKFLCKIVYNFGAIEQTARVFDNPTVFIFKRSL